MIIMTTIPVADQGGVVVWLGGLKHLLTLAFTSHAMRLNYQSDCIQLLSEDLNYKHFLKDNIASHDGLEVQYYHHYLKKSLDPSLNTVQWNPSVWTCLNVHISGV